MNLQDIYQEEGPEGLDKLAAAAACNPKYLYQCATGRREPSPKMARRLVAADSRLTMDDLYRDDPEKIERA